MPGMRRLPRRLFTLAAAASAVLCDRFWWPRAARVPPPPPAADRRHLSEQFPGPDPTTTPTNPNKALWEKGDFTRIARGMRESGEALVRRIGVSTGLKVLDLG